MKENIYDKKWNGKGYDENRNIIYELINGTGKVKEYYDNGKLMFEGEYLNGNRNGKGKEYNYDGKLEYEGEYLNGKRWNGKVYDINNNIAGILNNGNGKIKEFNENGELEFEGEYINGKKNGKGKEYYDNDKLLFEGEYLNGKRWNGKVYDSNNNISHELKNGKGSCNRF